MFLVLAALRATIQRPGEKSETAVFIGILSLLNVGGSIEYKGVKMNFAQVPQCAQPEFTVPTNFDSEAKYGGLLIGTI